MTLISIVFILLGLFVLAYGKRLAILGAGVGALLGIAIVRILPGEPGIWLWFLVPVGLAILFAFGGGIAKGLISIVTLALGALAGGAIVLALLDMFGLDWGVVNWLLALVGAVIGASVLSRFKDWGVIFLAALVGSLLATRGLQLLFPSINEAIASLIGLVLLGFGIVYQGGILKKK